MGRIVQSVAMSFVRGCFVSGLVMIYVFGVFIACFLLPLGRMSRTYEIHVVECDAEITAEYRFAGSLEELQGRGGTDLCPPLEPQVLRRVRPDVVVYFTDGDGPAPDLAPKVPVIWCLTPCLLYTSPSPRD